MLNFRSKKFRDLCRGQDCLLEVQDVCQGRHETVVPCHSPDTDRIHGSTGMNVKSCDSQTVPGCQDCHDFIDGRSHQMKSRTERQFWFNKAHAIWISHLFSDGKLKIK